MPSKFAVDSTGIRMSHRSFHYSINIRSEKKISPELKMYIAVDIITSPYLILFLQDIENIDLICRDIDYDPKPYMAVCNNAKRGLIKILLAKSQSEAMEERIFS